MVYWKKILYHCLILIIFFLKFSVINGTYTIGDDEVTTITSGALTEISGRIINGTIVTSEKFPYIVSLRRTQSPDHFCGGSLISEKWVISAAHCVVWSKELIDPSSVLVVAGELQLRLKTPRHQESLAEKLVPHPEYDSSMTFNDIAMISVKTPFQFNEYVSSIGWSSILPPPNTLCTTAGWGEYLPDNRAGSNNLLYARVPLVSTQVCKELFGYLLSPCRICAGPLEAGSIFCAGDSGGPLECNGLLTGIVSVGMGCSPPKPPGLYVNVPFFANWISRTIMTGGETSIQTSSSTSGASRHTDRSLSIPVKFWYFCLLWLLMSMSKYILSS